MRTQLSFHPSRSGRHQPAEEYNRLSDFDLAGNRHSCLPDRSDGFIEGVMLSCRLVLRCVCRM